MISDKGVILLKINPSVTSFKSNNASQAPQAAPTVAVQTVQAGQVAGVRNVAMDYNINVPIRYNYLGEKKLPNELSAHVYRLENGQKVVIIPSGGPTTINTFVNSGSMNEPDDKRGISHFIEHNLFNGSQGLEAGEFFKKASQMGANVNASTGFAQTDYYIQSHLLKETDLEEKVQMHSKMLNTPKFALDMIEKEKGPVTSEIHMILDNPQNLGSNEVAKMLYNINSTSQDIIGGTVENINKLNRDDVIDYYNKNYCPSNRTTVINGEVTPEEAMALISKYFNAKNPHSAPRYYENLTPIEKTVRKDLTSNKTNSAIISMGFNGPQNTNTKDKVLLSALSAFLFDGQNSAVNKKLEKINSGAFFTVEKISTKPNDGRMILVQANSAEKNCEETLKIIFEQVHKLQNNPPSQKELDTIKQKLKIEQASAFDNSFLVNLMVGQAMLDDDINSVAEFDRIIDEMTPQDLSDMAKKYFDLNKTAIAVIHPTKALQVAFTGANKKKTPINLDKIQDYQLGNNLNLITNQSAGNLGVMDFSLAADVPPDVKVGTSELFGIMLNKGTQRQEDKFLEELNENGILMNWQSSERAIFVNANFTPEKAQTALQLAKEIILTPRLDEIALEEAKQELRMGLENSLDYAQEAVDKEVFGWRVNSKEELLANLESVSLEDVKGLHQYILQNAKAQCTISADFDKHQGLKPALAAQLSEGFGQFKQNSPHTFECYSPTAEPKTITKVKNNNQAEVIKAYKFKTSKNMEDTLKFELLNKILGGGPSSLLFQDLREVQKLAYRVRSNFDYMDDTGVLSMSILTTTDNPEVGEFTPENVQKSLVGFDKHTKNLVENKIDEMTLENAKLALKSDILDETASMNGKTATIADSKKSFYGLDSANQMLEAVDKITVEDIQACAAYIFGNHPITAVYASERTLGS